MPVPATPPVATARSINPLTPPGTARASWALLTALVIGAAGGAGISAAVVHGQVRIVHDIRTVYVPVPSDPLPPGAGNVQRKV